MPWLVTAGLAALALRWLARSVWIAACKADKRLDNPYRY